MGLIKSKDLGSEYDELFEALGVEIDKEKEEDQKRDKKEKE